MADSIRELSSEIVNVGKKLKNIRDEFDHATDEHVFVDEARLELEAAVRQISFATGTSVTCSASPTNRFEI